MCLGIFPNCCFLRDNSPKIEHLATLLLYTREAFTKFIDVFIEFMNKESVLYISMLEYISDARLETKLIIRVEKIRSELSCYGNIKVFRC